VSAGDVKAADRAFDPGDSPGSAQTVAPDKDLRPRRSQGSQGGARRDGVRSPAVETMAETVGSGAPDAASSPPIDRAERPEGHRPKRPHGAPNRAAAAIDVGTNNCRLLIAVPRHDGFNVIDAFSRIVRLGEGVRAKRNLSTDAMDRTVQALGICARKIRRRGVTAVRAVATEACRRADNFVDFQSRVFEETGLHLELIDPEEEARLAFLGCSPLLKPKTRYAVVFDIGGGSTEVMIVRRSRRGRPVIQDQTSLPLGVVNLSEDHGGDKMDPLTYASIVDHVEAELKSFWQTNPIDDALRQGRAQMIGASGTVTTLSALHQGLPTYVRHKVDGTVLSSVDAQAISRDLLAMDRAGRANLGCIGRDRADVVVAGCAILDALIRLWPIPSISVADRGVREGILLDLMHGRATS